jgi:hypothetical protein
VSYGGEAGLAPPSKGGCRYHLLTARPAAVAPSSCNEVIDKQATRFSACRF